MRRVRCLCWKDIDRQKLSISPATVELHEIQATVLRYRPEPYYGTHVLLHIDDAPSGRQFLRRLAPHVASATDWWCNAGDAWIAVAISYTGLVALGVPEELLQSFPETFRVGMAARADILLDSGENDPKNWDEPVRQRTDSYRRHHLQRHRREVAPRHGVGAAALRRIIRGYSPGHSGLRRPAGRPQSAWLQRQYRPACHRGQRCRCPARTRTPHQGWRIHPRLPRRGRRAACDAAAGGARAQRHLPRPAQVPIAGRCVQPIPARQRSNRRRAGVAGSEAFRSLA